jgi:hypothetical protein
MKWISMVIVPFLLTGCSVLRVLDFGGDDKKPFEFRLGWDKGVEHSTAKPGQTDDQGVYQPETPEVEAVLNMPNINAGMAAEIQPQPRITPTVSVEAFSFKVPYARWFSVQAGAGDQLVNVYIGKRIVSVFEITVGPWVGWDTEKDDWAFGIGGTIIRF